MRPTVPEVLDKLATQGTADQIATFFEGQGINGWRSSASSCPVARYIRREIGNEVVYAFVGQVRTGKQDFFFAHDPAWAEGKYDGINSFIDRFDAGRYPALIQEQPA